MLPKFVEFREEGPREAFQMEKKIFPLEDRVAIIDALSETGLKFIQVGSFVHPKAIPGMADIELLFAKIKKKEGIRYNGVWLNKEGFERARKVPGIYLKGDLLFYTSDTFARRNNNRSAADFNAEQTQLADYYLDSGLKLETAFIFPAFGCNFEGDTPLSKVVDLARDIKKISNEKGFKLPIIGVADTMGWANPEEIKRRVGAVREILPDADISLHLHDTRGLGAANVYAGLEIGVSIFDSSVAGLGGCPHAGHKGAAGNICTEDMVFMCHELGIETGIDLEKLIEASCLAEKVIGRPLTGKIMHSGTLNRH